MNHQEMWVLVWLGMMILASVRQQRTEDIEAFYWKFYYGVAFIMFCLNVLIL